MATLHVPLPPQCHRHRNVALAIIPVANLNDLALTKLVGEAEVSQIQTASWDINCEKEKTGKGGKYDMEL